MRCTRHLADEVATLAFGAQLARELQPGLTFYLEGDLGAGKTSLVRGMLRALYHFDLYRMHDPREWLDAGFRDGNDGRAISLIEWPQKAAGWLPPPDVLIAFRIGDNGRDIECEAKSPLGARFLETCCTPY